MDGSTPLMATMDDSEQHPMLALLESAEDAGVHRRGDVVEGVVAQVDSHEILIDVGGKKEGILAPREFGRMTKDEVAAVSVGDAVECLVLNPNDREGNLVLSIKQARIGQDWDEAETLHEEGKVFEASVDGHNKGGLIVYIGQVRGFIPASQVDRRHAIRREDVDGSPNSPLARFVGQPIHVKVIEIDRHKNRLILSELAAMRERRKRSKSDLIDSLEEGKTIKGSVTSLADFGAFVDIGGADGLVHLSELSWNRVSHPSEVLDLGQEVEVRVISIDRERKRIGLSIKQLQPEPWSTIDDRYTVGDLVPATITRITDFGAFARLEDDIEGLIHISELSDEEVPPTDVVQPGDELTLRVIRIDPDRRRIGLSLKRADDSFDGLGDLQGENGSGDADKTSAVEEVEAAADAPEVSAPTEGEGDASESADEVEASVEIEENAADEEPEAVVAEAEVEADSEDGDDESA